MIDWDELIVNIIISVSISGIISYLIARYFRFNVKPKIEEIYEYNREYRIRSICSILDYSDWNMSELFKILEQNNCVGSKFLKVQLSPALITEVKEREHRLKLAYNDIYEIVADAKQYVAGDELILFLDFLELSRLFAEELSIGNYNPQWIRRRGIIAKKLVKNFREFFTDDFVKKWEDVEDSRLE